MSGRPLYITVAVQYIRSRQVTYVKDALQGIIRELIETDDLDLEVSPSKVHRSPSLQKSTHFSVRFIEPESKSRK